MSEHKNTIIAVVLSGIILVAWQYFFTAHYPEQNVSAPVATVVATPIATPSTAQAVAASKEAPKSVESKSFSVSNDKFKFVFDNDLSFRDAQSQNASYPFRTIVENEVPLKISLIVNDQAVALPLDITFDEAKKTFIGRNAQYQISFVSHLDESGRLNFSLVSPVPYRYLITFDSKAKKIDGGHVRQFLLYGNDVERHTVGDEKKADGTFKWLGIDFKYHLFSLVLKDKVASRYNITKDGKMTFELVNPVSDFSAYVMFDKKNYDTLKAFGDNLHLSVDFGFFAIVAVPILRGLQFFYKVVPNYGIAIILLTLLIRTLMFPLQYKSFKSMKKMQVLQPEITKLKEKYKADPARLQKETMDLFKRSGANPLSGCLPLVAQLPIFFAFYQVLNSSVELVNAPFFGWLSDLSLKDPYYVLPVLMTISMFFQQKMTPNTSMDATQQKIMMAMPLVFGFIMKDLSSGLVLYIFVSTMYGIAQQLFVYKIQKD